MSLAKTNFDRSIESIINTVPVLDGFARLASAEGGDREAIAKSIRIAAASLLALADSYETPVQAPESVV